MSWGFPEFRLREVTLDGYISGKLYLSHLPGRCGDEASPQRAFASDREIIAASGIDIVVCLLDSAEIERKSIAYSWAIASGKLPWRTQQFPIADFSVPPVDALHLLASQLASDLHSGTKVLVHCAAGIGRTGLVATATLVALGMSLDAATAVIRAAGSEAETDEQRELLRSLPQQH